MLCSCKCRCETIRCEIHDLRKKKSDTSILFIPLADWSFDPLFSLADPYPAPISAPSFRPTLLAQTSSCPKLSSMPSLSRTFSRFQNCIGCRSGCIRCWGTILSSNTSPRSLSKGKAKILNEITDITNLVWLLKWQIKQIIGKSIYIIYSFKRSSKQRPQDCCLCFIQAPALTSSF